MSSDLTILRELLADNRVIGERREAFARMLDELESGERQRLSTKQRAWAADEHRKLDLGSEAATNDVSEGRVPGSHVPFKLDEAGPMVKRPPGRRDTWNRGAGA